MLGFSPGFSRSSNLTTFRFPILLSNPSFLHSSLILFLAYFLVILKSTFLFLADTIIEIILLEAKILVGIFTSVFLMDEPGFTVSIQGNSRTDVIFAPTPSLLSPSCESFFPAFNFTVKLPLCA
jgi:hypothetical protein